MACARGPRRDPDPDPEHARVPPPFAPPYARLRVEEAERGRELVEAVRGGADSARLRHRRDAHLEAIARASDTAVRTQREAGKARNIFVGGLNAAEFVGLAAVLAVGFVRATSVGLSVGAVTAGALYFHRLFNPIGELLGSMDDGQRALSGLQRLTGVVLSAGTGPEPDGSTEIADGSIDVLGASYRYGPDAPRDALRGVDLVIQRARRSRSSGAPARERARLHGSSPASTSRSQARCGSAALRPTARAPGGDPPRCSSPRRCTCSSGSIAENARIASPGASDEEITAALDSRPASTSAGSPADSRAACPRR